MLCHPLMLSVYLLSQVLEGILALGTAIAFSARSSDRVREDFTWPGVHSNWERRRRRPKGWPAQQGPRSAQQLSNTDMRRSHSRTTNTTARTQAEMNGVAAQLCCTTIRLACSALIDEVQKMPQ